MRKIPFSSLDPILMLLALLLSLVGLGLVFDAGYPRSLAIGTGSVPPEFNKQVLFLVVSIPMVLFVLWIQPSWFQKHSRWIAFAVLLSLLYVHFFGKELNGARRWISLGPLDIQPAEFAKVAIIIYLASAFASKAPWVPPTTNGRVSDWIVKVAIPKAERAWPMVVAFLFFLFVEFEKDLGTASVILVTSIVMVLISRVSKSTALIGLAIIVFGGGFMVTKEAYRMERITNHVYRWDPKFVDSSGYQTSLSELGIAQGGLTGQGLGNGRAKHLLPATTTDFILATAAEEFGIAGPLAVLGLLGGIVWRLWVLAQRAQSRYAQLLLLGTAWWFTIQSCTNLTMANGTLPAIGIPFPFVSSGGSSLLALWMMLAICQSAAAQKNLKEVAYAVGSDRRGNGRAYLSGP